METWQIHHRLSLYLLDSIQEKFLGDIVVSKGRNVGEQFAHIHNVRLMDQSILAGLVNQPRKN